MSKKINCSVLKAGDVDVKGDSITFSIGCESTVFYLSEGAMYKVIRELNASLIRRFEEMSEELEQCRDSISELSDKISSREV